VTTETDCQYSLTERKFTDSQ